MSRAAWWKDFFDADYLRLWEGLEAGDTVERLTDGLWDLLELAEGSRVLDAPCGYGRFSRALAERGAKVLGVDLSKDLLAEAKRRRGELPPERLRTLRHDLRQPLGEELEDRFDVALNLFSSLGYGTEEDDLAVLSTLRAAVRPGGKVFIDTMHRDAVAVMLSKTPRPAHRLADGTLLVEEPRLDPVAGRVETTFHWSGPSGSGAKIASLRIYSVTELVRLLEAAGLRFVSLHAGCSPAPYVELPKAAGGRAGLLAVRG